uniref:XS domain-containing protein n=1 Tax=Glycine max TaxID=3847 RepID=A0A0R0E313_SOYBN
MGVGVTEMVLSKSKEFLSSMASSSDERYVWPWTGIVANIFGKPKHEAVECDSMYWLRKFEQYKPEEAYVLHCAEDPTGYVVLEFGTDWTGFTQMMKLDTDLLVDRHGKKDYYESRKMGYSSGLFGWCAQAEDYNSEGLVGNFLRQKAELKTTSMSLNEKTETLDHLYGEIGSVNKKISEMESKYIEDYMSLDKMMKEIEKKRDLLHQTRAEDDHVNCAPVLKSMIDTMNDELDRWCQQLIEQEKSTIQQRRKFEEEKKSQMESLILATEKQMKARSDVLSLLEKHQMEKKVVSDALLKLEKEMGNEQKLNLQIAELEEQLKVLKCVNSEEADHENKRKIEIEEIEEKLEDMIFDMSVKDDENQALKKKVQEAKTELEDARQQIIKPSGTERDRKERPKEVKFYFSHFQGNQSAPERSSYGESVGNGVGIACMKEETKRIKGKEKKIQMIKMEKEKIEGENTTTEKTREREERVMDKIRTIMSIKRN